MLKLVLALSTASLVSTLPTTAQGHRKALIIGNNAYAGSPFGQLERAPAIDAANVADALVAVGFARGDVIVKNDLDRSAFLSALTAFRNTLGADDSAVFYFSGHGFSIDSKPYLVPIGFTFQKSLSEASQDAISLVQVVDTLEAAPRRVIILDACRTSAPLLKEATKLGTKASLGALRAAEGTGSLVAYATRDGKPSSAKSDSGMSLFTNFLVRNLETQPPPADMFDALRGAKADTASASRGDQVPTIEDEMDGSFVLVGRPRSPLQGGTSGETQPNPYQQVKLVLQQVEQLEARRNDGIQTAVQSFASQYKMRGQPIPESLPDDTVQELVQGEYATIDNFKQLEQLLKKTRNSGLDYLNPTPIERENSDQQYESAVRQALAPTPLTILRTAVFSRPKPRFTELTEYLQTLANQLGKLH